MVPYFYVIKRPKSFFSLPKAPLWIIICKIFTSQTNEWSVVPYFYRDGHNFQDYFLLGKKYVRDGPQIESFFLNNQYYSKVDNFIWLPRMSEYDCHFKCKELSAGNVQRMFLECDDIKVLENSSGFLEFMKRYSRFDGKMITETIEKLNLRLGKIIVC